MQKTKKRIVIIGANAAGVDAAVAARKTDRECEIILLTRENVGAYSKCGMPFVLGGDIESFEKIIVYLPSFYTTMKLDLRTETTATGIDVKAKKVDYETSDGKQGTLEYDQLIVTTGASPFRLPIQGIDKEGVYNLHTLENGLRIAEAMKTASTAAVIGSGLVGLEVAEAFLKRGIKVSVIEMLPTILPRLLDPDMSVEVQKRFEGKNANFILGKAAEAIVGEARVRAVSVGGKEVPADIVVNAAGVRPNVELAKKAGIAIGETGGIKTNLKMGTNIKDVYAAGDCAEVNHLVAHVPVLPLLGSTAVREGKTAGTNAAGGYATFPGTLFSAVSQMFDFEVGAVGLTEGWANRNGIEVYTGKMSGYTRAPYYPGALPIKVKLIVEKENKEIVGGQIVGGEEVTQRINAISLAIQKQMTVFELVKADTCYAPSVCETWEPMVLAATMAIRKL
jgi:NADH oxidase (H2O2-forming)